MPKRRNVVPVPVWPRSVWTLWRNADLLEVFYTEEKALYRATQKRNLLSKREWMVQDPHTWQWKAIEIRVREMRVTS